MGSGRALYRHSPVQLGAASLRLPKSLGEHLEYVWTGAISLPGRHLVFRRVMIFGRWRAVAFLSACQH